MDTFQQQEYYILELIRIVLPDREFEVTTAPVMLWGNRIGGIRTLDVYALLHATPEQQVQARAAVTAEIERRRLWHERERAAELAAKQARGYPH
jgi:hypothetical protein